VQKHSNNNNSSNSTNSSSSNNCNNKTTTAAASSPMGGENGGKKGGTQVATFFEAGSLALSERESGKERERVRPERVRQSAREKLPQMAASKSGRAR